MPVLKVNCCLCGAPVDETQPWPDWMGHFRAVCTLDEQWASAFVSGVGERHRFNDLIPNPIRNGGDGPVDLEQVDSVASESFESVEEEQMEIDISSSRFGTNLAVGPGQRIWGFPFHSSCWDVLNAFRETQKAARHEIQALFDILRSFPRQKLIDFGHDYGGIAGYNIEVDWFDVVDPSHEPFGLFPGEEYRMVYNRFDRALLDMQKQDPMHVSELRSAFTAENPTGSPVFQARQVEIQNDHATRYSDPFGKLPAELLQSIISELPSPEVVCLKQSSRVFQHLPLPDTFWRSRFLPGREFEYVFEAFQYFGTRSGQWKTIYQKLRNLRKAPGFVNRCRIWGLARKLNDLLATRLKNNVCSGTEAFSYFEPAASEEEDSMWIEAHRCLRPFNQDFSTGCRELYVRTMLVPPNATGIRVSLVEILDKTYVCGLRFENSSGTIQEIGHIRAENEISLSWNTEMEPRRVVGFQLALDQHGIRGLCVAFTDNELSVWAGQYENIPKRRLVVPSTDPNGIVRLRGGFDALKLVSLSLSTSDGASTRLTPISKPSLRDTALWFPEIPEPCLSFSGITMKNLKLDDSGKHQRPLSTLMFDECGKTQLNRVDTIKLLIQQDHGVMGLEVISESHVNGKTSKFLGSNKPCLPLNGRLPPETLQEYKMSFDISAGEEVVALDVLQGHYVLCLKVYTNLGRVVEFPPPETSELDMNTRAEDEGELISVKPDFGKVVGFVARQGSKGLQNLGLVHMELPEQGFVKL